LYSRDMLPLHHIGCRLSRHGRRLWRGFGLREFHARDCQAGEGEFKGRGDRLEIQNKFYSIIDSADVDGVAVRVDLTTFEGVRRKLASQLPANPPDLLPCVHGRIADVGRFRIRSAPR